jgi:phosphatidylglycerol---prolipoprotein diacylglyceryl transferase
MYPNLYYAFKDLFGIELSGLKLINPFGFFVALCFIVSAWVLTLELRRKQQQGLFTYTDEKIVIGAPASLFDILINFLLGFVFGYKIIGAFTIPDALNDPQSFILSSRGNLWLGLLVGLIFGGLKWYEKHKQKLDKPEDRIIRIWPHDRVGDLVIYAAAFGFLGAKIFHNLENWNDFIKDPIAALISFSGLTFYGGLICAGTAIIIYAKRIKLPIIHLVDAFAPILMLGYGIGRIGCQVSGDGDWGIVNLKPKPISWMPDWLWSYQYPHNVVGEGIPIPRCSGPYCAQLPQPVYPTALYEVIFCLAVFFILWSIRKRIKIPGQLFSIYLIFNGLERFTIENIRVNTKYESLPFQPTQAQIISVLLFISGCVLFFISQKNNKKTLAS